MFNSLALPPYSSVKHLEGIGNYAVRKYYKLPWSYFYRKKLRMARDLMSKSTYYNILDFGYGCGIFTPELSKRSMRNITSINYTHEIRSNWNFDLIMCCSVLEFCDLELTLWKLKQILKPTGEIIVSSPMKCFITDMYYKLIGDKYARHSHNKIVKNMKHYFNVEKYITWNGLYFGMRAKYK